MSFDLPEDDPMDFPQKRIPTFHPMVVQRVEQPRNSEEVPLYADERRDIRSDAVHYAVFLHGETEMEEYMRQEIIESVLKTAQSFYDWIIADA